MHRLNDCQSRIVELPTYSLTKQEEENIVTIGRGLSLPSFTVEYESII